MKEGMSNILVLSRALIGQVAGVLYAPVWLMFSPLGLLILHLPALAILGGGISSCLLERSRKENRNAREWLVLFLNAVVGGILAFIILWTSEYDFKEMSSGNASLLYLTGMAAITAIAYALANGLRLLSDESFLGR